jgi:hypothetical protein
MNKQDIVVGGIYEFDLDLNTNLQVKHLRLNGFPDAIPMNYRKYGEFKHIVINGIFQHVLSGLDRKAKMNCGELFVESLGKQVGFDATYTDEYKQAQKKCETIQSAIDACDTIISYEKHMYGTWTDDADSVSAMKNSYQVDLEFAKDELSKIKATSWFKEGDNA